MEFYSSRPTDIFLISRTRAPFLVFRKGELRRQRTFLLPAASVVLLFQIRSTRRDSRSISVVECHGKVKEPTAVPFQMLRQECSKLFTRVFFSRVRDSLAGRFSPCTLSGRVRCRSFAPIPATSRRRFVGLKVSSLFMLIGAQLRVDEKPSALLASGTYRQTPPHAKAEIESAGQGKRTTNIFQLTTAASD